jgi:hypothetical protein
MLTCVERADGCEPPEDALTGPALAAVVTAGVVFILAVALFCALFRRP